jgi:hypothetical protein
MLALSTQLRANAIGTGIITVATIHDYRRSVIIGIMQ